MGRKEKDTWSHNPPIKLEFLTPDRTLRERGRQERGENPTTSRGPWIHKENRGRKKGEKTLDHTTSNVHSKK